MTTLTCRSLFAIAIAASATANAAPAPQLAPGDGYVAIVYDSLQPLRKMTFNFNAKRETVVVGDEYEAGRHLVVQTLPAGRYCLQSFIAGGGKREQSDRLALCFDVEAGEISYGGHLMPRRFNSPNGTLDMVLKLSDPVAMVGMIEKEAPEIWERYRGAPARYAPNDAYNRGALEWLGEHLYDNRAHKDARNFLQIAYKLGSGRAALLLGIQHLNALGVDQDYALAAQWFRKGADADDARSAALLCVAYDLGRGVPEDPELAVEQCSRAAERDDSMGLWYMGSLLRRGRGVPADSVRAAELEQRAEADQEFPRQMYFSYELRKPDKTYPDPEGAMRLAKLALARDVELARRRVARYTLRGVGVPANGPAAAKLYLEAADKGWDGAYWQLAQMYGLGRGVPVDVERAHIYLAKYASLDPTTGANDAAWFMATAEVAEARDGKRALELATKAIKRSPDSPAYLDTLAAAYAELGRWDEAVAAQRKAISILNRSGASEETLRSYQDRLDEYRKQTPHREKFD